MKAASYGRLDSLIALAEAGADLDSQDIYRRTALHHAAIAQAWTVVVYLLNDSTVHKLESENTLGETIAASIMNRGPPCLITFLLSSALDPDTYRLGKGNVLTAAIGNVADATKTAAERPAAYASDTPGAVRGYPTLCSLH